MAERRTPPNWAAIEGALTRRQRQMLDEACATLGYPRAFWMLDPALAGWMLAVVPLQLAADVQRELRCGFDAALSVACDRLGLSLESFARRLRTRRATIRGAQHREAERADVASGHEARLRRLP